MRHPISYSAETRDALALLGGLVQVRRRERRMTVAELAERVGVSVPTLRKVERGDPTVALGVAFEAAAIVGVPLFAEARGGLDGELRRVDDRLAVLPRRIREPRGIDDAF